MLIRVVDLETTGFEPPEHAVVEIGWCDLVAEPDLLGGPTAWRVAGGGSALVNPGRPIPPETSAVHHIVDQDVADAAPWADVARLVFTPEPIAFAAHSAKFERLWCCDQDGGRPWICTYKAALRLWPDAPLHSNQGLRYWRRPEGLDRTLAGLAHRGRVLARGSRAHVLDAGEERGLVRLDTLGHDTAKPVHVHRIIQRGVVVTLEAANANAREIRWAA